MEAEIVQQQAPPSYGQLIAQGAIPPVEDFPTENPNDVSRSSNLVPHGASLVSYLAFWPLILMSAPSPCRTLCWGTYVLCFRSYARI